MTQTQSILSHLKKGRSIDPMKALKLFGCFRLASRIWDLKNAGHDIESKTVHKGEKHYSVYKLKTIL